MYLQHTNAPERRLIQKRHVYCVYLTGQQLEALQTLSGVKFGHTGDGGSLNLNVPPSVKGNVFQALLARSPRRCCWGCWWRCRHRRPRWESRWRTCCTPALCGVGLVQQSWEVWRGEEQTARVKPRVWSSHLSSCEFVFKRALLCAAIFWGKIL